MTEPQEDKKEQRTRSESNQGTTTSSNSLGSLLCGKKRKSKTSEVFRTIKLEELSITDRAYYLRDKYVNHPVSSNLPT
jgi:hypothetical protein